MPDSSTPHIYTLFDEEKEFDDIVDLISPVPHIKPLDLFSEKVVIRKSPF